MSASLPAPGANTRSMPAQFLSAPFAAPASASAPAPAPANTNGTNATNAAATNAAADKDQPFLVHYGMTGTKELRGAGQSRQKTRALASWLRLEVQRLALPAPAPGVFAAGAGAGVPQPAAGASTPAEVGAPIWAEGARLAAPAERGADFPLGRSKGAAEPAPLALAETARLGGLRYAGGRLYAVAPVWVPAEAAAAAAAPANANVTAAGVGADAPAADAPAADAPAAAAAAAGGGRVAAWWVEIDQPSLTARRSGVVAYERGSLLAPTIAVNKRGRAIIAATAVGRDLFPSAAVATLDFGAEAAEAAGAGDGAAALSDDDAAVAAPADDALAEATPGAAAAAAAPAAVAYTLRLPGPGAGLADGEGAYSALAAGPGAGARPAASAVGVDGTLWSAVETASRSCSLEEYKADATCGGTRTAEYNWATRVTQVEVDG